MSILNCHNCGQRHFDAVAYCAYCGVLQRDSVIEPSLSGVAEVRTPAPSLPAAVLAEVVVPVPPPMVHSAEEKAKKKPVNSAVVGSPSNQSEMTAVVIVPPVNAPVELSKPQVKQRLPPSQAEPSKNHTWKYVAIVLVVTGVGIYFFQKSNQHEVACNTFLTDASAQFTAGNFVTARGLAKQVPLKCSSGVQSRAAELLATLDNAEVAKTGCDKTLRTISSLIIDRKMTSARNALDHLDNLCMETAVAKDLRQKVVESQTSSVAIEAEVRSQLVKGDANAARAELERLAGQNREHPDLANLETQILTALKPIEPPAEVVVATPAPLPLPPVGASPIPLGAKTKSAESDHPELVQAFLRDAEHSLSQQKFDAARTFVESARRIDPMNAQAAVLWRRIKEREHQYLKDETSIK